MLADPFLIALQCNFNSTAVKIKLYCYALIGGHLKGGLKAHELTRRSSPYDIMAILIFASPEGAGQRASEVYLQWREKYIFSGERRYLL